MEGTLEEIVGLQSHSTRQTLYLEDFYELNIQFGLCTEDGP